MLMPDEYGPLSDIVLYAGYITAAVAAVSLAWRGRRSWEPAEEDVSKGPQKVGALVAGVWIVLLWVTYQDDRGAKELRNLTVVLAILTVLALLAYGFLISTLTYEKIVAMSGNPVRTKIVGGFRLTEGAKKRLTDDPDLTIQKLLKGSAYDPLRVWTNNSRALAKLSFVVAYLALTIFGTVALAGSAIILSSAVAASG